MGLGQTGQPSLGGTGASGDPRRRIRVAVASSGLGHVARGCESWAAYLGAALHRRGVDVTLCKGGGRANESYERVLPCWQRGSLRSDRTLRLMPPSLAWRLGLSSGYGLEQATFAWSLIKYLRAEGIDVLHVQDPHLALWVQRAGQLGLVRTRSILAHGTEEPPEFLRKIDFLHHLAPWHEQECRAAGVSKPAWTVLPHFVDTRRFCPGDGERGAIRAELGIPKEALVVLTAAAIKRTHKRVDAVIEEVARLRAAQPDLPVWLVVAGGKSDQTDEVVALGNRLLGDRVRFLVQFPLERMAELYRMADVFVLGSLMEMLGIVLLEATASGVPCIVNRHPVLEWVVGPGGEAIDMTAPGELAHTLGSLLRDPERRANLGRRGREHCRLLFGEEAVVSRILEYYGSVVGSGPGIQSAKNVQAAGEPARRGMRGPSVSVVIPAYNAGAWIVQAVQSVLDQSQPPDQIIVVNDGSTDDTRDRLIPYMDRICYIEQPNQGVAATRNRGMALARGDLIALLDADDVWHPGKLELQVRAMAENPDVGLLGTAIFDWPAAGMPPIAPGESPTVSRIERRGLAVRNYLVTSTVIMRRELAERVGGFDIALHGPEDHDYWLRAAEVAPVGVLRVRLTGYRSVPGSLSKHAASMEAGMLRILTALDARDFWRGDRLLRRRAQSYVAYASANLHGAAGDHAAAIRRLVRSLLLYPLPFRRAEAGSAFVRARRLAVMCLRLLGMTRPEASC